ncbi:MAG: PAS domain-containing protein [Bacteroidetes bacterium]|nr:PAS domain-containing protein [Bacteroidota bacterium]
MRENIEYLDIFNSLPVATIVLRADKPDFTVAAVNSFYLKLAGVQREAMTGKRFFELDHIAPFTQDPEWESSLYNAIETGRPVETPVVKFAIRNGSGQRELRYVSVLHKPVLNEEKQVTHIISIVTDCTQEYLTREKEESILIDLVKKERFLYETQRIALIGSWEVDMERSIIIWSDVVRDIYEVPDDFVATFESSMQFYKEPSQSKLVQVVEAAIRDVSRFDLELEIVTAKGNERWIRITGMADATPNNTPRIYGTTQDITEHKRIEQAFIESSDKYQSLIQTVDGIVWEADAETLSFSFVSDKVKSILGYSPEEWYSDPDFWANHIHPEDRAQAVQYCLVKTRESQNHSLDYRMIKADGDIIWIKDIVSVIDEDGKPKWLRGLMVDITETHRLNELDHLEKHILELNALKDMPVESVLTEYIKGIESIFPGLICTIHTIKNNRLYNWASPSMSDEYINGISGIEIGEGIGSCGTAAYRKKQVIVSDIATDPLWIDYRDLALAHSLKACWSQPVIDSKGTIMGVLGVYYREVKEPEPMHLTIIERSVEILRIILENRQNAALLNEMSMLMVQGQELANLGNWQWDIVNNIVVWSDVLYHIYGLDKKSFKATFEGYLELLHPEDRQRVYNDISTVLQTGRDIVFEERILRPTGELRNLRSWGRLIRDESGKPIKMIGACLDITESKKTEAERQNYIREIEAQNQQLQEIGWKQSHVARAPVARIMGLIGLAGKPNVDKDELLQHIMATAQELDEAIKEISGLTNKQ